MELEERLIKVSEELSPGNLVLETNVQVKVVRPILRSLGWDDSDSRHLRAEFRTDKGRVDEALLDELGSPVVFVEAKKQGHLKDRIRYHNAVRQLFRYARYQHVPILLLTDGETWDFFVLQAAGPPSERRFLRLTLTEPDRLTDVASDLRRFLTRTAVLDGSALRAAQARLKREKARAERMHQMRIAWNEMLASADKTMRSRLADKVERDVGRRPAAREVNEFLRAQSASALLGGDPTQGQQRPYTYDELFPDDLPRTDYTRDELEHLLPEEMSDVIEWWTEEWGVDWPKEHNSHQGDAGSEIEFVLNAQNLYGAWVATVDEIHEAAAEHADVPAYLGSLKVIELRAWAVRLDLGTSGLRKQDLVATLAEAVEWF